MFYAIGRELFSSQSPSGVFGKALKLCKHDLEVRDGLHKSYVLTYLYLEHVCGLKIIHK